MIFFGFEGLKTYVVVLYVFLGLDFGKLGFFLKYIFFTYMSLFLCIVNTF